MTQTIELGTFMSWKWLTTLTQAFAQQSLSVGFADYHHQLSSQVRYINLEGKLPM